MINKNITDLNYVIKEQTLTLTNKNTTEKAVDKDLGIKKKKENMTQNGVEKYQSIKSENKVTTENYSVKEQSINVSKKNVEHKDHNIQLKNNTTRSSYVNNNVKNVSPITKFLTINYVQNTTENINPKTQHLPSKMKNITRNDENTIGGYITQKIIFKDNNYLDNNIGQNIIPQIQKRLDSNLVKKSLDEFKMVRRKTHFTMPDIKYNDDISHHDHYYQDIWPNIPKYYKYDREIKNEINVPKNGLESDYYNDKVNYKYLPSYHYYPTYEEKGKIVNLLRKQTKIIRKLVKTIEIDGRRKKSLQNDFDALMSEVEAKQELYKKSPNYTAFTFETTTLPTTTISTTTKKPSTVITLFDETEVRNALKNDPHVKRILKMASRKRDKYLKNARKYYTFDNYAY